MALLSRRGVRVVIVLAGAAALVAAFLLWGVRALITGQLQARYDGHVSYSSWWVGGSSSGLRELALGETPLASSPVWARAKRVETDLTLGKILTGRFAPNQIRLVEPRITFRLGANGELLTLPPLKGRAKESGEVPRIRVESGRITIHQEGRPEMVLDPVLATLSPGEKGVVLDARVDSEVWGQWKATGSFEPGFVAGTVALRTVGTLIADGKKRAMVPFVPQAVWDHVQPLGPVHMEVDVVTGAKPSVITRGEFVGATLHLPTLGLVTENTTGRMVVQNRVATIDGAKGRALGGEVGADGRLDFSAEPPQIDLTMNFKNVDVLKTPKFWQLADAGITGDLTGTANLKVRLTKAGADLSGSEGTAVVANASLGGIAVKNLKLSMKAEGDGLRYRTEMPVGLAPRRQVEAWFAPVLTAIVAQDAPKPKPQRDVFVLPKTLSTEVEFEGVDLVALVAKARALGIPLPFKVGGKLSLKAKATIPLGSIRDVRLYAFHGIAKLTGASIDGVDVGAMSMKVDLDQGVLDLTEVRGHFLDRPHGHLGDPPPATELPPLAQALPLGAFRGHVRAEIDPPGKLDLKLEANSIPIGELLAPALPRPTSISGLATFSIDAEASVAHLDDPAAWVGHGTVLAKGIRYRDTLLEKLSSSFELKDARITAPDLTAILDGQPLRANVLFDAVRPFRYSATVDSTDWNIDSILGFVPSLPRPAPVGGRLTMHMKSEGTLRPFQVKMDGEGSAKAFRAGPLKLGDVPIRWRSEPDRIRVTIDDARPLGGTLSAEADIPADGNGPIRGSATFQKVDIAAMSVVLPTGGPVMAGKASGTGTFVVRPLLKKGESALEGNLTLTAPELTIEGVPARSLQAILSIDEGVLKCDLYAEGLGGKGRFQGNVSLENPPPGGAEPEANGSLHAVGFRLEPLWKPLGFSGAMEQLDGLAAIRANLRTHRFHPDLRARGIAEVRDLRWGKNYAIGGMKGTITLAPEGWEVNPVSGEILGGIATGSVTAVTPNGRARHLRFRTDIERASLKQALAFLPAISSNVDGYGSLRLSGRMDEAIHIDNEFTVPSATFWGLPIQDLRMPGEIEFAPGGGQGTFRVRRWSTRFAGGRVTGDSRFGLGTDPSFQVDSQLSALDLETVVRVLSDVRRPASGKVSGKFTVSGADLSKTDRYRGRVDLDLEDASVVELPVFRELDKFLGAARGGVFEDGSIHAMISNKQLQLESLTLSGRLVQLHGTGTIGFDSRLDLVVLINTNQVISQTGQALAGLVPGIGEGGNRRAVGLARFGAFLSNRLLKFRVTGTLASPAVELDPALAVSEGAIGFFAGVLMLPLELIR